VLYSINQLFRSPSGLRVFLLLGGFILLFMGYWFPIESRRLRKSFSHQYGPERGALFFFIFNKLWGTLLFGGVGTAAAFLLFPGNWPQDIAPVLPLSGTALRYTFFWSASLLPLIVVLTLLKSRATSLKKADFGRYPEISLGQWKVSTVLIHAGFWSLYLFAYELMFRGYLLLPLVRVLGPWPAIGINVALYSAVHIPKGLQEAVGALILGFLLCLITLQTGSIAVAFNVHAALAVTNGLGAVFSREDMEFVFNKKKEQTDE